jgi:hypothetical protein
MMMMKEGGSMCVGGSLYSEIITRGRYKEKKRKMTSDVNATDH